MDEMIFDRKPVRVNWDKYGEVKEGECTVCKKKFIQGLDNVCKVERKPETLLDWEGNPMETLPGKISAYLCHTCYQSIFNADLTCKHCGVLCKAKVFPVDKETKEVDLEKGTMKVERVNVPIEDACSCSCHKGVQMCTLLAPSYELEGTIKKLKKQALIRKNQ